jgi:ribosomal protein L44E
MRCPDCNKFASFDTEQEPEVDSTVSDDGQINLEVRIVNTCADCGTELKEGSFSMEMHMDNDELVEHYKKCKTKELSISDESYERVEESRGSKNPRYAKRFYGVEATITVECKCGHTFAPVVSSDYVQASAMDEMV